MGIISDYGITIIKICANGMGLVRLVVKNESCAMQESFFSGQHARKFKLVFKEFGKGVFGNMPHIFWVENLFAKGVNLLNSIERDESMYLSVINKFKKFPDGNEPLAVNIGVSSEYVDIYNRGIKVCFQQEVP